MHKPDLAARIAESADMTLEQANNVVNVILEQIGTAVNRDEPVNLMGFGTFRRSSRAARAGRNPQTGEKITIAASNSVTFKPGKAMKDAVNR